VLALAIQGVTTTAACTQHQEPLTHACPTVVGRGVVALAKLGLAGTELEVQEKC